jgi:hypothetical protein
MDAQGGATLKADEEQYRLNYFNYFTEIEDAFVRRRGKHLLLSSMDWALIESWKEMNIPLHVALRGVEKAFDSWESKPRKRSVKSLLYCQEEVEAQFAEWLESQVGSDENTSDPVQDEEHLPFARPAVVEHLQRGRTQLTAIAESSDAEETLKETIVRAIALLDELEKDFVATAMPSAQKLETSLTGIERMLSESISASISPERLLELKAEVKQQLKPYRSQMDQKVYEQTFESLLLKSLRETFRIPRLSLFYL